MIGKDLAHYKVLDSLGKGGMGEVYLAEDSRLGRKVALKTLPPEMAADPERRARFEREAKVVAALNHPNIVTIHSVEEHDGVGFITMEHVEGESLSELIPEGGMPLFRLYDVAIPLADALAAAHAKGITHRDLKPGNVMVTKEGRVKVLDFGLAKLADPAESVRDPGAEDATATATAPMTVEGSILGTVAYMSPEQAEGKPVDPRSDVFSFGVVLYEMATGRKPFGGDSTVSTLSAILRDTPQEIVELNPSLPRHLGRIVRRCLEKDPSRRYPTALDVRNELESLKREGDVAPGEPTPVPVPPAPRRRRPARSAGLAAVAIVAAVAAGVVLWPKLRTAAPAKPAAAAKPPSIAVLPFANMSSDADNEYFSDGLAEELLNVLSKLQGLRVAARTSSFHFKGYTGAVAEIGRQLDVTNILEGSVRRSGDRVRVTAQLINAADGFHLWSDTYDRRLDDIFAIQEDIATQVVDALKVTLLGDEAERLAKRPTESIAAYDAYLLGQQRMARRRSDSLAEAIDYFEKAIELDPKFALAHVGLADATLLLSQYGTGSRQSARSRMEASIEQALALDDRLGEAYASRGTYLTDFLRDIEGAEKAYQRAIELNPSYAMAYMWYGGLIGDGDPPRRLELCRKALELDPLSPIVNRSFARALVGAGRFDEALDRLRRVIEIDPGFAPAYRDMADLYMSQLDRPEEAISWYEKAIEVDAGNPRLIMDLSSAYLAAGRFGEAITLLRDADAVLAESEWGSWALVETYVYLGRTEDALNVCRRTIDAKPNAWEPYASLAQTRMQQGRLDEAVRSLHVGLTKPGFPPAMYLLLVDLHLSLEDEVSARGFYERLPGSSGDAYLEWAANLLHSKIAASEVPARRWVESMGRSDHQDPSEVLWFYDLRAERFAEAMDRYEKQFPRLVATDAPRIRADSLGTALNVASTLARSGDRVRAASLLRACEEFVDSLPDAVRDASFRIETVELYALQGRTEDALAALRRAIDNGWRMNWWMARFSPSLESIAGDPRFAAMIAEVREDLARQRQRLSADGLATP